MEGAGGEESWTGGELEGMGAVWKVMEVDGGCRGGIVGREES